MFRDEKIINLVKQHSVLYDMAHAEYYDVEKKEDAWDEIGLQLKESGDDVKTRWNQLRDAYRKNVKKQNRTHGEARKHLKPWKYAKQIAFLRCFFHEERLKKARPRKPYVEDQDSASDDQIKVVCELKEEDDDGIEVTPIPASIQDNEALRKLLTSCENNAASKDQEEDASLEEDDNLNGMEITPIVPPAPARKRRKCAQYNKKETSVVPATQVVPENNYVHKNANQRSAASNKGDHLTSYFKAAEDTVRTFSPLMQVEVKGKISALLSQYELKNVLANMSDNSQSS